jgi:hypothetical protein
VLYCFDAPSKTEAAKRVRVATENRGNMKASSRQLKLNSSQGHCLLSILEVGLEKNKGKKRSIASLDLFHGDSKHLFLHREGTMSQFGQK